MERVFLLTILGALLFASTAKASKFSKTYTYAKAKSKCHMTIYKTATACRKKNTQKGRVDFCIFNEPQKTCIPDPRFEYLDKKPQPTQMPTGTPTLVPTMTPTVPTKMPTLEPTTPTPTQTPTLTPTLTPTEPEYEAPEAFEYEYEYEKNKDMKKTDDEYEWPCEHFDPSLSCADGTVWTVGPEGYKCYVDWDKITSPMSKKGMYKDKNSCVPDWPQIMESVNNKSWPFTITMNKLVMNTEAPTSAPTTPAPTTGTPTFMPTAVPTATPTKVPTDTPTNTPTAKPTAQPTAEPTAQPTAQPTAEPTAQPTAEPTAQPTSQPTSEPTASPTVPTSAPTKSCTSARKKNVCESIGYCHWGKKGRRWFCLWGTAAPTLYPTNFPTKAPTKPLKCESIRKKNICLKNRPRCKYSQKGPVKKRCKTAKKKKGSL